jgi:hypothetical protein
MNAAAKELEEFLFDIHVFAFGLFVKRVDRHEIGTVLIVNYELP